MNYLDLLADEEKVFLIGEELEFRAGETDGEPNFVWRDLHGDVDEFFEFVASGTNGPTCAFFETCMYRAMYERKYKRNAENIQDTSLEEFVWRYVVSATFPSSCRTCFIYFVRPPAPKTTTRRKVPKPPLSPVQAPSAPVAAPRESTPERTEVDNSFLSAMSPLFAAEAELYYWDTERQEFRNDGIVNAQLSKQTNANYVYWLTASNDKGLLLTHTISSSMNQRFSPKMLSLTWNHLGDDNSQSSWLFRFNSEENFGNALETFTQCLWESLHQSPWGKIKVSSMI